MTQFELSVIHFSMYEAPQDYRTRANRTIANSLVCQSCVIIYGTVAVR